MNMRLSSLRRGSGHRRYLLFVLTLIYGFTNVDRLALGIALQNIKTSFRATDAELGILSGIAFALFYSTLGVPIGRWADRGNRITIITITTAIWGFLVMLTGAARSFAQLLLIRMGVAVGEAGNLPPAYSLIGDYYERWERPMALSYYLLGAPLSLVFGYSVAGWVNQLYGWRTMFAALGVPGLVLAAVGWLTLREPRTAPDAFDARGGATRDTTEPEGFVPLCRELWRNATYRRVTLMLCVLYIFNNGFLQWQPAFFIRSFGIRTGELGLWFAAIFGLGGAFGTYCGGRIASKYARGDEARQLRVYAIIIGSLGIISAGIYLSPNLYASFGMMTLLVVAGALGNGPLFAALQGVVPEHMRAISISIVFLFANLIGMGLGPLAVGVLSDAMHAHFGAASLRYALLAMCPVSFWAAWLLWQATNTVVDDIRAASKHAHRSEPSNQGPGRLRRCSHIS